ncbi:MAG: NAD-dependent epimerase/dehydratase family protein [Rhodospirillales bacterium]|nr:NAD-dependent epimerase/dehydratase family protein [Rhodospirillales bacterium]
MTVLVTGAAGFIGSHVAHALLARGDTVVAFDNLDPYYDVVLKEARLARLTAKPGFTFERVNIADRTAVDEAIRRHPKITRIVHLAAQAGVRYSLTHPHVYAETNVVGHLAVVEASRRLARLDHFVFASSSSVYGANTKLPFSIDDPVDKPISIYAASKRAGEMIGHTYSHLYGIPQTGLRFFTVYGPWGRPDMAAFIFTRKILAGEPIPLFNNGDMRRDFTYVDDTVRGVLGCLDHPPSGPGTPFRLYNIGNHRSEPLRRLVEIIEASVGRKATIELLPMQTGDVRETFADIEATRRDFGFEPTTPIDVGIPRFVEWYRCHYNV